MVARRDCRGLRASEGRVSDRRRSVRSLRAKPGVYGRLRYALRMKRRPRSLAGLARLLWEDFAVHVLFEGGEVCQDCGRRYPLWHADYDENLWERVIGHGGGLLCPGCFDRRAREAG